MNKNESRPKWAAKWEEFKFFIELHWGTIVVSAATTIVYRLLTGW